MLLTRPGPTDSILVMVVIYKIIWKLTGNCRKFIPDKDGICQVCRWVRK
jgi:hypothetical protein